MVAGAFITNGGVRHQNVPGGDGVIERAAGAEHQKLFHAVGDHLFHDAAGRRRADVHAHQRKRGAVRRSAAIDRFSTVAVLILHDDFAVKFRRVFLRKRAGEHTDECLRHIFHRMIEFARLNDGCFLRVKICVNHGIPSFVFANCKFNLLCHGVGFLSSKGLNLPKYFMIILKSCAGYATIVANTTIESFLGERGHVI